MNWARIATFVLGWGAGIATPLLVELLRRRLFSQPRLRLSLDLVPTDPEYARTGDVLLCLHAVNLSDVPVILTSASFMVWHGKQAVGLFEEQLPGLSEHHEYPIRMNRHDEYTQSVPLAEWICDFLDCRIAFYDDYSDLDYSSLAFDVSLTDTTRRTWESKRIKLGEYANLVRRHVRVIEKSAPVEQADRADGQQVESA